MDSLALPLKKRKLRPEVAEEVAAVEAGVVMLIPMEGLRLRTVKESTLASTSLKSTTWFLKNTRSPCRIFILTSTMIIVEVVEEEAAEEEEVDVVVTEKTISKTTALRPPKKIQRMIFKPLKDSIHLLVN